jgi:hypothetical protein
MQENKTLENDSELDQTRRIKKNILKIDWKNTNFEDLLDLFEDRDPTEFI